MRHSPSSTLFPYTTLFRSLVSDVRLPDGSGLDLMRELSRAGPVKGIAISGFGSEKDVSQSREAGFDRHLVKPVAVERVVRSEEHTSELQSLRHLVCRLLLE